MKVLKNILAITIPSLLFTFLLLEFIFRFIIPATDSPKYKFNKEYGFLCFDEDQKKEGIYSVGRFAEIRAKWKLNNYNWNCAYDFSVKKDSTKKRIVVIGASYVEGLLVNQQDNFTFLLNEKLKPSCDVYPIGISGVPLSGYPNMIRYAVDKFNPDIILLYNYVSNIEHSFYTEGEYNISSKIKLTSDSISFIPAKEYRPSKIKRFMAKSAFVRYLIGNLQLEKLNLIFNSDKEKKTESAEINVVDKENKDIKAGCDFILHQIKCHTNGIPVILMQDVARNEIYEGTESHKLSDINIRNLTKTSCNQNGIFYLDLADYFIADYKTNKKKFEFANDFHWNAYGNSVVSDCIYQYLTTSNLLNNGLH